MFPNLPWISRRTRIKTPKSSKHGGKEEAEEIRIAKSANNGKDRRNLTPRVVAAFLAHEPFQFGFFGSFGNSGDLLSPLPPFLRVSRFCFSILAIPGNFPIRAHPRKSAVKFCLSPRLRGESPFGIFLLIETGEGRLARRARSVKG